MKRTVYVFFAMILFFAFPIVSSASGQTLEEDYSALDEYSDMVDEELDVAVDDETHEQIEALGIEEKDVSQLTLGGVFSAILDKFTESITEPLRILGRLTAVLILTSLARSFCANGSLSQTFTTVSLLGCMIIIYQVVYEAFSGVCGFLDSLSKFMLSYIPIFTALTAASGGYVTAGSYYASVLAVCEIVSFCADKVIMSFLSLFLALSFTAAINPSMKFSSAAESVKNAVRVILGALMTIFTGIITVQSFASSASDNAASRAVKFSASSFVPIIGSSVSEAYSTVYAGIGIIRSSVGGIGIVAVAAMLLSPLVTLICVKIIIEAAKVISDLLGLSETSELLKSVGYAMSAAISTTLCFAMMFIVSTAIVMAVSSNIGE